MNQEMIDHYPVLHQEFNSVVLDIPKIEPDDWDLWWKFWNENKQVMTKVYPSHNSGPGLQRWEGIQIVNEGNIFEDPWDIQTIECRHLFPNMFKLLDNIPMDIKRIRAVTSTGSFKPHTDHRFDYLSLRVMFYDNNPGPTFYYVNNNRSVEFQKLPETSNTWIYKDQTRLHGSYHIPKHEKILFMIFGKWRSTELQEVVDRSLVKYKDYCQ